MYGEKKINKLQLINNSRFLINKKLFFTKKINKYKTFLTKKINFNNYQITIILPPLWNLTLLTLPYIHKKLIYFYNNNYFFIIPININSITHYYDKNNKGFLLTFLYRNNFFLIFWKLIQLLFNSLTKIFFLKLKFKGKGYYVYKNKRNTIAFKFGYSHIKRVYLYFSYVKFLSKTSILIYGINNFSINNNAFKFFSTKPINIFTGKGIRFTRQIIYRKTGKISSYR